MIVLPAATSEYVDVPVTATGDPMELSWEATVDDGSVSVVDPAPATGWMPVATDDHGATASPRYTVRIPIDGLSDGDYGMWLRVDGGTYASPVRFAGRLRLY